MAPILRTRSFRAASEATRGWPRRIRQYHFARDRPVAGRPDDIGVKIRSTGNTEQGNWSITTRPLQIVDLGRMRYADALAVQQDLASKRKQGLGMDTLLFVEHPHVVTMGRNGKDGHVLASPEILARTGIDFFETDRGGDVTYHGPGQIVGYPILDLREWKRDVRAYFRGVEQSLIDALSHFGINAARLPEPGCEGVWVDGAKIAAIGIHISRWITTHGFALNLDTDLQYFQYIVPCGLTKPVCSFRSLGNQASREEVQRAIAASFAHVFDYAIGDGTTRIAINSRISRNDMPELQEIK